jgi:hypothetical protein
MIAGRSGCSLGEPRSKSSCSCGSQLSSGLLLGLDAGVLAITAGTSSRATALGPQGLAPNSGTTDDALNLRGMRVGPSFGYRFGDKLPITLRLGAGMMFEPVIAGTDGLATFGHQNIAGNILVVALPTIGARYAL